MRWLVIVLLVAVTIAGYAVYSLRMEPESAPPFGIIPGVADIEYRDGEFGFSIMYPETAKTSPTDFAGFLPLTQTPVASFVLPESMYAGTNLAEAGVYIGATSTPELVSLCLTAFPGSGESETASVVINGTTFSVFTSTEAAAGNIYEANAYRTVHNGQCFELVALIHSGNIGNYPEGTVVEFDKAKFRDYLSAILRTFAFI